MLPELQRVDGAMKKGVQKGTNIDKNRWVLTTLVMDGSNMSLYENGKQIGKTTDTGLKASDLGATTGNILLTATVAMLRQKDSLQKLRSITKH